MFVLVLTSYAENDIEEAALWYEHQRKGLGMEFLLAVEDALTTILRSPNSFGKQRRGYRRSFLRRFPYGIIYRIEKQSIVVVAAWHFSRKPSGWRKRMRNYPKRKK